MGAMSSEIFHFLKVKLPLQNDQRWLPLLSWFSKFSQGVSPNPLSKMYCNLQSNTALHKTSWKSEIYNSSSEHTRKWGSTSLICDLMAKDLLKEKNLISSCFRSNPNVCMIENCIVLYKLIWNKYV